MTIPEPALKRSGDNPGLMFAVVGDYRVTLALTSNRLRVVRELGNDEVFNRVNGVEQICDWAIHLEDNHSAALLKRRRADGHEVIWLYDPTDEDNYGIGINLTPRELTEWGPTP